MNLKFVCFDSYHICLPVEYMKDFTKSACVTNRANVPAKNMKSPIVPGELLPLPAFYGGTSTTLPGVPR